ncbi:MAG: EAL domain-containing protein [Candidatus Nanopelagicales bacterium]
MVASPDEPGTDLAARRDEPEHAARRPGAARAWDVLAHGLPLAALLVGPDGRIALTNRYGALVLGRVLTPGRENFLAGGYDEQPPWLTDLLARVADDDVRDRPHPVSLETIEGPRRYEAYVDRVALPEHGPEASGYALALLEVTTRRADELALRRASTVFANTTNAIVVTDGHGRIVQVNPAFTATFGWRELDVIGHLADEVLRTSVWTDVAGEDGEVGRTGRWNGEATLETARAGRVSGWLTLSDVRDGDQGRDVIAVFTDITPLKDSEARLDHLARHDPLTGLVNRVVAMERLQLALHLAARSDGGVAVLFLDLDRFKEVNDGLGHAAGDRALREVASRLAGRLRAHDVLARLGGDEFLVVADGLASAAQAQVIADKLLAELRQPVTVDGRDVVLTASVGISVYPRDAADADTLVRNADAAMYEAKETGRNRARFYTPELTERASERLLMETELRRTVAAQGLSLHYQPIVTVSPTRLVRLEALLRWTNERVGPIPPSDFIPLAEDIGLMPELGAWVLDEALRQLAEWRAAGVDVPGVAVNASPTQIETPGFVETVVDRLEQHGIAPGDLEVEVTEGTLFRAQSQGALVLHRLADAGVRIAIDDFGSGYSSLARLEELPVDVLKIDRAFVSGLGPSAEGQHRRAVVTALIDLAHAHRLRVTAEGIERPDELAALAEAGCEFAQGYLISRPVPADDVPDLVGRLRGTSAAD